MTKLADFRKLGWHAGDNVLIKDFINQVLTQTTVWQEMFVAPNRETILLIKF